MLRMDLWKKPSEAKYHGLVNHGATCYLNSVLQVLFMTEEFREAVTSPNEKHIDHHLKELFEELLQRPAYTYQILRALEVNNVNVQQDAAEYFERILRKTSEKAAQIFHGKLSHRTTCLVCQTRADSVGPFWHLPLDLDGCENYSVENGLNEFFTPTIFDGENQMYCDNCDAKVDADRKYVITHHPDVMLLVLKRFDFSYKYMSYIKVNCTAEVPHTLKIPENQTYELYAVVEHIGDLRSGHYRAIIKPKDDEWYIFNDTSVSSLGRNPFSDNANIAQSTDAYLLFYRKKNCIMLCSIRDPNLRTTQDSNQSQNQDNLQDGDGTETLQENIPYMDDSAQNGCSIKQMNDKEGIKDSLFTEAKPEVRDPLKGEVHDSGEIEKEKSSQSEMSDEQRLIAEQTERKKQTEGRGQDETRYTQDVIIENAESDKQEENCCFPPACPPAKNHILCPDAGKTEPTKFGNMHDNHEDSSERAAIQRQQNLREEQKLPEQRTDEGKQMKVKRKHQTENIQTITMEDTGAVYKAENNKRSPSEDLSQAGKWVKEKEYSDNPAHPFHDENTEDVQKRHTGQKVHPSHDRQCKLDLETTTKKKNYKTAATLTGNQVCLQGAEAGGHSSSIEVCYKILPRGKGNKKVLAKITDEETVFNHSFKTKEINNEGNVNRESDHCVSFSAREETITPHEPLLSEHTNATSKEPPREANKDECRLNCDPLLETPQIRKRLKNADRDSNLA